MSDKLYVCFTMDCERVASAALSGPESWEIAERSVRAFAERLLSVGHKPTFFVVPETARRQARLFQELQRAGAEIGLHFHEQTRDAISYLGACPAETQHQMLSTAREKAAEALGSVPAAFRPGFFSANDSTFAVLCELGFTHGSVSLPGRCAPGLYAVWAGANPFVHCAHADFRSVGGKLDFVEVPMSVYQNHQDSAIRVRDLRLEAMALPDLIAGVRDVLSRQAEAQAPIRHLCFLTHNCYRYWEGASDQETPAGRLLGLLARLPELVAEQGLRPVGATTAEVRRDYLAGIKDER